MVMAPNKKTSAADKMGDEAAHISLLSLSHWKGETTVVFGVKLTDKDAMALIGFAKIGTRTLPEKEAARILGCADVPRKLAELESAGLINSKPIVAGYTRENGHSYIIRLTDLGRHLVTGLEEMPSSGSSRPSQLTKDIRRLEVRDLPKPNDI